MNTLDVPSKKESGMSKLEIRFLTKMNNKKSFGILLVLLLFFTNIFSIRGYDSDLYRNFTKIVLCILIIYTFFHWDKLKNIHIRFKKFVLGLIIIPILGFIPAYILHGQGILASLLGAHINLGYFFFFFLFLIKAKEEQIVKIFCILGICWSCIELVQQFTYPTYWFATRGDNFGQSLEIRNGIYRYSILGREFGLILLFYCFERFMHEKSSKYLLGILIALVGIYLLATRQIMAMSIICLFAGLFMMKKISVGSFVLIAIVSIIIYANAKTLFGEFIEMTESVDKDYIRFLAYEFYGITYNKDSILAFLLGNGVPYPPSAYSQEIDKYEQSFGLWRADIGIVGMYSWYGIIYAILILWFFTYVFKHRKYIDSYLLMYVLFMAGTSVMLHHFGYKLSNVITGCFIFYLIEMNISKNKQRLNSLCKNEIQHYNTSI